MQPLLVFGHARLFRCRLSPSFLSRTLVLLALALMSWHARADILVPTNSVWRFMRGTNEASAPTGREWRTNTFDDSSWETGQAPFYFGTNYNPGSGTFLSDMQSNYFCIFLRSSFVITNPAPVIGLSNRPFAEDGYVIWLNGIVMRQFNLFGSTNTFLPYNTNANVASFSPTWANLNIFTNHVRPGTNVFAIQVFNRTTNDINGVRYDDGDFFANPELAVVFADIAPPLVQSLAPAAASTVTNLAQLAITFNEPVTNVSAANLRVNGQAATTVTASNANTLYTFRFPVPAAGNVLVTWDPASLIKDLAGNIFNGTNASYAFTHFLDVPRIIALSPAAGSTVSNLTQLTVTFNVPLTGISAPDLLVNGNPASTVSGAGTTRTFTFVQPPPGLVQFGWDNDHVISDAAGNRFDETAPNARWTCTLLDGIPPAALTITPAPGATVRSLTQVAVTFREPVTGVDAADLLINGQPANSVIPVNSVNPVQYVFTFPQPASGNVTVSWANSGGVPTHNIRDSAGNLLNDAAWNYTLTPALLADIVINEILTDNLTSLADEDRQKHDWIELFNRGGTPVSLLGWSLTDDPLEPGKWTFPAITLNAGQYLIVFASAKDRKTTSATMTNHTNFRLSPAGGYLGLYGPELPRIAADEFQYPAQRSDISYGRTATALAYFSVLTPRAANSAAAALAGFAQPPHLSVKSGFFDQPFNLVLTTETPGAQIRYTLDGSPPTASSPLYSGPAQAVPIAGTPTKAVVMVRAAAFKPGLLPSLITTRSYIFPDHVLTQPANPAGFPLIWDSPCTLGLNCNDINPADYEMDPQVITNTVDNYRALARQGLLSIPTVSLVTDVNLLFGAAEGVYVRREPFLRKPVSAEYILPDGSEGFQIDCGLEMQGQTSPDDSTTGGSKWKSLKLGLRLFFQGEFGPTKLHYKVFEDSPLDEFDTLLLAGGHNNYWNYNNNDTQRTRSVYVRDQFVADLQNAVGSLAPHGRFVHLYLNGLYWGLYQMHERPDAAFAASYQGGDKQDYDAFKHDSSDVVDGTTASYATMWGIINAGLTSNASYEQLQQYVDVRDLINYLLVNYWANNTDWAHKNLYATHRTASAGAPGQWRFHAWDSEHVLASTDFAVLDDNEGTNPTAIFNRLLNNAEFRILLADQIHKHFFNDGIFYVDPANRIYNPAFPQRNPAAHMFVKMLQEIDTALVAESARWGDVGPGRETNPHTRNVSFFEERDILLGNRATFGAHSPVFFPNRSIDLMTQFRTRAWYPNVVAPSFNQHGGRVAAGFNLTMTAPAGTIYYTTNGADPRLYGSGTVSSSARIYTGSPVALGVTTVVKARVLSGSTWSALNEATFLVAQLSSPLRITEIMYNPPGGEAYEFIELQNTGTTALDLGNHSFNGINFIFPVGYTLGAGQRIVLGNNLNTNAFATRYSGVTVAGWFGGSLANGGETISILDAAERTVLSVSYDDEDGWPSAADGAGSSLEIIDVNGDPDAAANWRASSAQNGTPGQPNSALPSVTVIINEVMAENLSAVNHEGTYPDWIELLNPTANPIDLTSWSLSDDGNERKYIFPNGTTIPANGYLIVWCDGAATSGLHSGFALGRNGETISLYDASVSRVDAISFGPQAANYSIGRTASAGAPGAWALTVPTTNAANIAATLAPASALSINEWLANPAPGLDDWLELFNTSSSAPVALRDIYLGTSNALFQIKSLSFLPPRGYLQLHADGNPGADHLDFTLPSGGAIVLYDTGGGELQRVTYGPQAQGVSQGRLPDGTATIVAFIGSASPGATNYVINYTGPVLNELLARNRFHGGTNAVPGPWGNYPDYLEIHNPNPTNFNLGGFGLSDDAGEVKFVFGPGTTILANGFLVVWCDGERAAGTNSTSSLNSGFSLSGTSGGAYLFNAAGQLVNFVDYGFQVANQPIGLSSGQWRLLASATPNAVNAAPAPLGLQSNLRINEWMALCSGDDWFELFNRDSLPASLSGLFLTDDLSLAGLSNTPIAALSFIGGNDWVQWIADGNPGQGRDHARFDLDAEGDSIRLYGSDFTIIDSISFGAQLENVSQGRLPDGGTNVVSFPTTPTPEASNYLPLPDIVINEALTHTDAPLEDAIEIQNIGTNTVAIGDWFISNSQTASAGAPAFQKFRIPSGTTLAPGQFKVFYETNFNAGGTPSGGAPTNFTLNSAHGDAVYLSQADAGGNLTGYRAQVSFGAASNGVSFGRFVTSVGADFVAMAQRTFGADNPGTVAQFRTGTGLSNSYPKVGPVIINEIMYHPNSGGTELVDEEFVELHNITDSAVPLSGEQGAGSGWRLSGGVSFVFSANHTIPARGYLLLVNFDPTTNALAVANFRAKYGNNGSLAGPLQGRLDNAGEELALFRPDTPQQPPDPDAGFVPMILVDRVVYDELAPWPAAADGGGASLQRLSDALYGNEPLNWKAEPPTAGGTNAQGALIAPTISTQPTNRTVTLNASVSFTVVANGSVPLSYQWQHAGTNLPGANSATLAILNAQLGDAGAYRVMVTNLAGNVTSAEAILTVLSPPIISAHPQSQTAIAGSTAQFNVSASGTAPLHYQWRFKPLQAATWTDLNGQTNPQLTLGNVQLLAEGHYSVVITNSAGSSTSAVAALSVLVPPMITGDPVDATVSDGAPVTFTVSATGTAPLTYQWRKDGLEIPGANGPSYSILAAQAADEGFYSAVVTNAAGTATSLAARLRVSSAPFLASPRLRGDGAFEFQLNGQSNRNYAIEFTVNFGGWTNLTNVLLGNPQTTITDFTASNAPARFYRVRTNP